MNKLPSIDDLPFLRSLCWQGNSPDITLLSESEILQLYERNWRYKNVMADVSEVERQFIHKLARRYGSWIGNDV